MNVKRIDMEHQYYKDQLSNSNNKSLIKKDSPNIRKVLTDTAALMNNNQPQKTYVKWILNKTLLQYYLLPLQENGVITLVKHDFNSLVGLRYCNTITPIASRIFNKKYAHAVEVVYLHSFKKGEGSKILMELNSLMIQLQLPLVLYTEKEELVGYYEERGFTNYGTHGDKKEYFMVKFP